MSTATATATKKPEIPGPGVLAAKQLWTTYTFERGRGRSQHEAAEVTLDQNHVSLKSDRERITTQLLRQELEWGLSQTPQEQVEEAEREAAEAEAVEAAHAVANPPAGTIPAIRADAQRRVVELEAQRSRLAPEALTDADAKAELADIESELAEARKALELADLADSENVRRQQQAITDAAQAAKDSALAEAHELQGEREKAVKAVDAACERYVAALVNCRSICDRQAADLARGGEGIEQVRRRRYNTDRATWALCHFLLAQGGTGLLDLGNEDLAARHKSLAQTEPSPV